MKMVTDFLASFNVTRKVYVSPLSSYNEKFYSGNLLFQCLYDQKRKEVFAAGGRYDQLIKAYQPVVSRRNHVNAVGFQLAWTGLCRNFTDYLKKIANSKAKKKGHAALTAAWRTRRCDVLVKSFDTDLLKGVGVRIVQQLWASNISSDVAESNVEALSDNVFTKTQDRSEHGWIVLVKSEDLAKVKNTSRDDEVELNISDLIPHIRSEIRERDRLEDRASKVPLARIASQQDTNQPSNDREPDIKVLMSQNKGKKVNRKTIIEEGKPIQKARLIHPQANKELAKHHKRAYLQSCADSPIVAIETKDDTFDGIAETRLSDPDSWKKFIQSAAPGERHYLGQLQNMLKGMAKEVTPEGNDNAIIYNFRTKACVSYNIARAA